jgi:predicted nucleotidyltransferase
LLRLLANSIHKTTASVEGYGVTTISDLKDRIIETFRPFDPERIVLFGSMARSDHDEASDVDLIIVYETDKRFLDRLEELYLSWNIPKAVDILAYTPSEYESMAAQSGFLQKVLSEGQMIYERE